MNPMVDSDTLRREKYLFAYTTALERGDFARLEEILASASKDPILQRQIMEIHAALSQPPSEVATPPIAQSSWLAQRWQLVRSWADSLVAPLAHLRLSWGRAGATLIAICAFLLVALVLLGPRIGKTSTNVLNTSGSSYPMTGKSMVAIPTPPGVMDLGGSYSLRNAYPGPASVPTIDQMVAPNEERLIVRNGNLTVVTKDTRAARQAVMDLVAKFAAEGAFVVSSQEGSAYNGQMPSINMVLRVPVSRFDECMAQLAGLGTQVLNRTESAQDVTQDYVDTTGRIQALETSRARLLEIIQDAKTIEELLQAEQALSARESELEAAKGRQQYLATTAALSSISLGLQPVVDIPPAVEKTWNPADTFDQAAQSLRESLQSFIDGAIYFIVDTLPWLAALGLVLYFVVRFWRRKAKG
jgi:hypothetical protein